MSETETVPVTNNVADIKRYFEQGGGRKVEIAEIKGLSKEGREELGALAREQFAKAS